MNEPSSKLANRRKRPAWVEMFSRGGDGAARAEARGTWHTDVPNIKLSRAFVVVLVLHVVAIGGILAFELFKPHNSNAVEVADAKVQSDKLTPSATPGGAAEVAPDGAADRPEPRAATPAERREEESHGYERYIVQRGDDLIAIADRFRISRTELLTVNRIDAESPLVPGRMLRIPKAQLPGGGFAEIQPVSNDPVDRPGLPATSSELDGFTPLMADGGGSAGADAAAAAALTDSGAGSGPDSAATPSGDDDGYAPLGVRATPPVSESPTPDGPLEEEEVEATGGPPAMVAEQDRDAEGARPEIVAPRTTGPPRADPPRVVRSIGGEAQPAPAAASGRSHTVVAGETLYRISRKYGVSVDAILSANPGVRPETLAIGKSLRIP